MCTHLNKPKNSVRQYLLRNNLLEFLIMVTRLYRCPTQSWKEFSEPTTTADRSSNVSLVSYLKQCMLETVKGRRIRRGADRLRSYHNRRASCATVYPLPFEALLKREARNVNKKFPATLFHNCGKFFFVLRTKTRQQELKAFKQGFWFMTRFAPSCGSQNEPAWLSGHIFRCMLLLSD